MIFVLAKTTGKPEQAIDLLNQAVARDPSFFQAYLLLASFHEDLYRFGYDHTPARLAMAEAAIQEASRLRPDAGETHLAQAGQLYARYWIMPVLWLNWKLPSQNYLMTPAYSR